MYHRTSTPYHFTLKEMISFVILESLLNSLDWLRMCSNITEGTVYCCSNMCVNNGHTGENTVIKSLNIL